MPLPCLRAPASAAQREDAQATPQRDQVTPEMKYEKRNKVKRGNKKNVENILTVRQAGRHATLRDAGDINMTTTPTPRHCLQLSGSLTGGNTVLPPSYTSSSFAR